MEIPALPDKESRLREPDKDAMNTTTSELDKKFNALKETKRKKLDERKTIM
jgi:hypothetical protein